MIPLDRLVLGTAKCGLPQYGYHSTSRPTAAESIAILRHAWRKGIRLFDTALGYGDAVYLLAAAGIPSDATICKCRLPLTPASISSNIPAWLIHNPQVSELLDVPCNCGVSVYTVAEVEAARQLGIAPIQAPASCLNPAVDVEYGRAPFLQGVLLRHYLSAPKPLQRAVEQFQNLAAMADLDDMTVALHAAYGERIVFGVSSIAQLDQVLAACEQDVPEDLITRVRALASTVDATAALPSLWSKP